MDARAHARVRAWPAPPWPAPLLRPRTHIREAHTPRRRHARTRPRRRRPYLGDPSVPLALAQPRARPRVCTAARPAPARAPEHVCVSAPRRAAPRGPIPSQLHAHTYTHTPGLRNPPCVSGAHPPLSPPQWHRRAAALLAVAPVAPPAQLRNAPAGPGCPAGPRPRICACTHAPAPRPAPAAPGQGGPSIPFDPRLCSGSRPRRRRRRARAAWGRAASGAPRTRHGPPGVRRAAPRRALVSATRVKKPPACWRRERRPPPVVPSPASCLAPVAFRASPPRASRARAHARRAVPGCCLSTPCHCGSPVKSCNSLPLIDAGACSQRRGG